MNIDFHYGVIYVVARMAGMSPADAETVAHACQYVDDSTTPGVLVFQEGQTFDRFASAHEMCDYANFLDHQNRLVWAPFHFLPGNEGNTFEERVVCRKNSAVAREMVRRFIAAPRKSNDLQRLGVLVHTYVDTWAHFGFSGTNSARNAVHHFEGEDYTPATWHGELRGFLETAGTEIAGEVIEIASTVGHGAALHFPDLPWAKWRYRNGFGEEIERENLPDFVEAAKMAYKAIGAFRVGQADFAAYPDMADGHSNAIREVLANNRNHDALERLKNIGDQLTGGKLADIPEALPAYVAKGPGSWKYLATGITSVDDSSAVPLWSQAFEQSDYRKFHDAVKEHRMDVTVDLLPSFDIRLA